MNMTDRNYLHSRPLDVHLTSNHPELTKLVDLIFEKFFQPSSSNQRILKKHLKLVLLELYVAGLQDPLLEIGIHMSPNSYSDGTVTPKGKSKN